MFLCAYQKVNTSITCVFSTFNNNVNTFFRNIFKSNLCPLDETSSIQDGRWDVLRCGVLIYCISWYLKKTMRMSSERASKALYISLIFENFKKMSKKEFFHKKENPICQNICIYCARVLRLRACTWI